MKKHFLLIFSIGMIILIAIIFSPTQRTYGETGKADLAVMEEQKGIEQIGPPWYAEDGWQYRVPVSISSNNDHPLLYYQVLVELNSNNFNFNHAKNDGSDIRFTDSSGKNQISFWIESWDKPNQRAYIWILVATLLPEPYDTTIYLYYDNPTATSISNGPSTFDSFDDNWCWFPGAGCITGLESQNPKSSFAINNQFTWSIIGVSPNVPLTEPGILNIGEGSGIKSSSTYQYQAVGFRANFGLGSGKEMGGFFDLATGYQTMIGDLQSDVDDLFLINKVTASNNTILEGVSDFHNAFHIYEVRWKNGQSTGDIDHGAVHQSSTLQVPGTILPVTLYSEAGSNATLKVDWVYVRQYHDPEPTANLGTEQGLVDLGITMSDSPDPLPINKELSYQISINNTSGIDATGVVVTDTLPDSVEFIRAIPSNKCNHISNKVICNPDIIPANSTTYATIVVVPTIDGNIPNSIVAGSAGYELDLSNNSYQVSTLVDSIPPNVTWENPVHDGQNYSTTGGLVGLAASATDNDQIAWVEFWYWDHIHQAKVSIGIDNSSPYQWQFNSDVLAPNQLYQMFVQAADRAGNVSSIYVTLPPVIYVERISQYFFYLPIAKK
jgi:uncharacterized repeat protein (TIGR01451 family)